MHVLEKDWSLGSVLYVGIPRLSCSFPCLLVSQPLESVLVLPILHHESSVNIRFRVWKYEPSLPPSIQLSSFLLPHLLADCILGLICMQCSSMRCTNYSTTVLVSRQTVHTLTQKISYFYGHCNAIKRSCSACSPRCLLLPLPYHTNFLSAPFSTVEDDWVSCWGKYGCASCLCPLKYYIFLGVSAFEYMRRWYD